MGSNYALLRRVKEDRKTDAFEKETRKLKAFRANKFAEQREEKIKQRRIRRRLDNNLLKQRLR